eukprot:TRINITY_DN15325_c0_g1_i1.p1 TRINITY_DN15325_c0_g1~~TRINITY_DN15325_c0_g1_i1.p1  ORF type:complete len:287 (-),score=30.17 TRINITY_DN15325_c0_g1_i1:64-924(-)
MAFEQATLAPEVDILSSSDVVGNLNDYENLLLGCLSGSLMQLSTQPITYWKNAKQQGLSLSFSPRVVFRGTLASVINISGAIGVQFISFGCLRKLIDDHVAAPLSPRKQLACAFIGGAAAAPFMTALEMATIQQQLFRGSLTGTLMRFSRTHGLLRCMRGLTCTIGREGMFGVGLFGVLPISEKYFSKVDGLHPFLSWQLSVALSAGVASGVSHPIDTAKTCMQGDLERRKYGGVAATARVLVTSPGGTFMTPFRGLGFRFLHVYLDISILDTLAKALAPLMFSPA